MVESFQTGGFRPEALKRLRSPDDLERLFALTSPVGWLTIAIIGLIIVALVIWGFAGLLPFQVYGMGIILEKGGEIYPINSPASGTVTHIFVRVGDAVVENQPIIDLALPNQEAQRKGTERTLADQRALYKKQSEQAQVEIASRRQATDEQNKALLEKIRATRAHLVFLKHFYVLQNEEMRRGYVTQQQVETTVTQIAQNENTISDAYSSIAQAASSEIDFEDQETKALAQLRSQIISTENTLNSQNVNIATSKVIYSPVHGTVAEISTELGSDVNPNDQLVMIHQRGQKLQMIAYLPVTTSKTTLPGMTALVSPTTVESSIYGSIKGRVKSVSPLPATRAEAKDVTGNDALVSQMFQAGPVIQAVIELQPDLRTATGLAWTSSMGPPFKVTSGSLASVAVTVMEDRPVDLVVPIYETWIAPS